MKFIGKLWFYIIYHEIGEKISNYYKKLWEEAKLETLLMKKSLKMKKKMKSEEIETEEEKMMLNSEEIDEESVPNLFEEQWFF